MLLIFTTKTCCHDVVTTPQITFVTSTHTHKKNPNKPNIQGASAKLNGQYHLPV